MLNLTHPFAVSRLLASNSTLVHVPTGYRNKMVKAIKCVATDHTQTLAILGICSVFSLIKTGCTLLSVLVDLELVEISRDSLMVGIVEILDRHVVTVDDPIEEPSVPSHEHFKLGSLPPSIRWMVKGGTS